MKIFFFMFIFQIDLVVMELFVNWQLFGDSNADIFQQYGIPMNPTDATQMPGMDDRQRSQNDNSAQTQTGSELMSYQQVQTPIDFTEFLNLDDNDLAMNASGSFVKDQ